MAQCRMSFTNSGDGSIHVLLCFALWYALNVAYNVTNKWALDDVRSYVEGHHRPPRAAAAAPPGDAITNSSSSFSLPLTIGCMQFLVGATYSIALWTTGMRTPVPHVAEMSSLFRRNRDAEEAAGSSSRRRRHRHRRCGRDDTTSFAPALRGTVVIAVYHTLGQLCTMACLSSNSIGFAHVVKSMEPFLSSMATFVVLGQVMNVRVYLSLLPVVGGVLIACAGSDEFSWTGFAYGMGSNAFFAMRGATSKVVMDASSSSSPSSSSSSTERSDGSDVPMDEEKEPMMMNDDVEGDGGMNDDDDDSERGPVNENDDAPGGGGVSPANLFGAVTCVSFVLSVPLVILFEGGILADVYRVYAADASGDVGGWESGGRGHGVDRETTIFAYIVMSGLFHYLNNEVMYLVLSNVHPITLAVGNTMKRVFIIVTGVLVFATPVSLQTAIGSAIAIVGVFVYSLMKQWYGSSGGGNCKGSNHVGACAKAL